MLRNLRSCRPLFAVAVCHLLVLQPALAGQSDMGLKIIVLEGNGAQNVLNEIPPQPISIRVVDRENQRIEGATVVFTAPNRGASGEFADGGNVLTTTTDDFGKAVAPFFRANSTEGAYQIEVVAKYKDAIAVGVVKQSNVLTPKKSFGKLIVIMAVAGAAAGAAVAARGGSDDGSNSGSGNGSPVISFGGSASVGAPR